jgi:hypothetical protein
LRSVLFASARVARRIVVATVGATVLAIGLALIVLPGPAFIVIPIGLGILGIEFAWARRWLRKLKEGATSVLGSAPKPPPGPPPAVVFAALAVLPLLLGVGCRPGIEVGLPDPLSGEIRVEIETRSGFPGGPLQISLDGSDITDAFVPGGRGLVGFLPDPAPGAHQISVYQPIAGSLFGLTRAVPFVSPEPAPPRVASRPAPGAGGVLRTAWLEVELAAAPDPAALAGWGFGIECDGRRVRSQHHVVSERRVVVNPTPELPAGATCRIAWRGADGSIAGFDFAVAPDAAGAAATALYDRSDRSSVAPFPDDYWLVPDASRPSGRRIAIEFPNYLGLLRSAARGVARSLAERDGWSPVQPIVLSFSHAVDAGALPADEPASLDSTAPIALFDADPASPGYGTRVGYRVEVRNDFTPALGVTDHTLLLYPARMLREGGRYALVVTKRLHAQGEPGRPFGASSFFTFAAGPAEPGEIAALTRARATLEPALAFLAETPDVPIPPEDVALAVPISVRSQLFDPADWVAAKQLALAAPAPVLSVTQEIVRARDRVLRGTIELPSYLNANLIAVNHDAQGELAPTGAEAVPFVMRIPNDAPEPMPIVIYQHGSPGSPEEVLSSSQTFLVDAGYAVIGIQDLANRQFGANTEAITTQLLLRVASFGRGPLLHFQTQADLFGLLRAVRDMGGPAWFPEIDPERVFYRGISFGAHHSLGFLPFAPEITAAVSVVGGGRGFENTLHQLDFFGTLPALQAVLSEADAEVLLVGLAALQNDTDRDDPIYLARHLYREPLAVAGQADLVPPSLLWLEGIGDSIVSNNATRSAADELGIPQVEPVEGAVSFLARADAPLAGNVAPGVTGGHFQYRPVLTPSCVAAFQLEGHYCPQVAGEAAEQILHFFATAEAGTAEIVNPLPEAPAP